MWLIGAEYRSIPKERVVRADCRLQTALLPGVRQSTLASATSPPPSGFPRGLLLRLATVGEGDTLRVHEAVDAVDDPLRLVRAHTVQHARDGLQIVVRLRSPHPTGSLGEMSVHVAVDALHRAQADLAGGRVGLDALDHVVVETAPAPRVSAAVAIVRSSGRVVRIAGNVSSCHGLPFGRFLRSSQSEIKLAKKTMCVNDVF